METLDRLFALETFGIKLGLSNISALCEALGHPERAFASLHIGGTNGKGSVAAMVHAALRAAGIHAARYTSPHLVRLNERFVIDDVEVSEADLISAAGRVLDCADGLVRRGILPAPPTFFEATTAMAFDLFRRADVQVAVLEVGLGGRFDATNVVVPLASAITTVGLDHQQHLGTELAEIAREKAGIIKPRTPVAVGALAGEAWAVIRNVAAERQAPVMPAIEQSRVTLPADEERCTIEVRTPNHHYGPTRLALRGEHQVHNALVAIALLECARSAGVAVPYDAIERGLASAVWPARLEVLTFPGARELLLDAAHNPDGARSLARFLSRFRRERPPLVFAAMRDKDATAILRELLPAVGPVVVTLAPSPRASAPDVLGDAVRSLDPARAVEVERDPVTAVQLGWAHGRSICVAGSIFLVGAVRDALQPRAIVDSSP